MRRSTVNGIISCFEQKQKDLNEIDLHDLCSSGVQDLAFQPELYILVLRKTVFV